MEITVKRWTTGLLLLPLSACASQATDQSLLGCWRSGAVTSYLQDGTAHAGKAECTIAFDSATITSKCIGGSGPFSIGYSYEIVAPGKYVATITKHSTLPQAVGAKRQYDYRVLGDELFITTYPQTTSPAPLNAAVKVVSNLKRDKSCKPLE
jgi:hypothetical protein